MITVFREKLRRKLPWNETSQGELRGGTPAVPIPQSRLYLSFFHTRLDRPNKLPSRYYMGAMTFRIEDSRMVIIDSISPFPIVLNGTYNGAWAHPNIDYVLYPTGIIIDPDEQTVVVAMCHQDVRSLVVKLNLKRLLLSLRKIDH